MKILQVFLFKTTASGPTTVLKPVMQRLNNQGNQVDVFSTLPFDASREKLAKQLNANYYYMDAKYIKSMHHLLQIIPSLKEYDLIHIHGMFNLNNILLARILRKLNIPYVLSTHGNLMRESLKKSKYKKKLAIHLLIKKMLKNATAIHVLNKQEATDVAKIYPHQQIKIIPNGVDVEAFNKVEDDFQTEKLTLLFIGRLDVQTKGLDMLLDVLDSAIFEDKLQLFIVGPYVSDNDKRYIEGRIAESMILQQIIKIEGPKYGQEKNEYYKQSDVFIHTSRHEGMPMAVLESMAVGIPSIITPGTNMVDPIQESSGDFIADFDKESIRAVIYDVLSLSSKDLYEIGQNAKYWSQENLSWNRIADFYVRFYQESISLYFKSDE